MDIHPYWSFEGVCKLAVKVEKYSKGKRLFASSYTKPTALPKPFIPSKSEVTPKEARSKDKEKAIVKESLGSLMARSASNAKGMAIFKLIVQTREC